MPNSAVTTVSYKRMARVASAAMLTVVAIATAVALTFPTYSWAEENTANEDESPIKLVQLERSADGGPLGSLALKGDYLLPAVGGIATANGELVLDDWGMPASGAFVDMIVGATNCSKIPETNDDESAINTTSETSGPTSKILYTRVLVAVPAALETFDDPATTDADESQNSPLHLVDGSHFARSGALEAGKTYSDGSEIAEGGTWANLWAHEVDPSKPITINDITYNLHVFTYKQALGPGETTQLPAIVGFYLDPRVDYDYATGCLTVDGESTDLVLLEESIGIPVSVQAIETGDFSSATAAFAAHNPGTNPWNDKGNEGLLGLLKRLFGILGID